MAERMWPPVTARILEALTVPVRGKPKLALHTGVQSALDDARRADAVAALQATTSGVQRLAMLESELRETRRVLWYVIHSLGGNITISDSELVAMPPEPVLEVSRHASLDDVLRIRAR